MPVFISLKTGEEISRRMLKTELAAEGGQETCLISAEKETTDEALSDQKWPWLETDAAVLTSPKDSPGLWIPQFLRSAGFLREVQ